MLSKTAMMVLTWLGFQPKTQIGTNLLADDASIEGLLSTAGVAIEADSPIDTQLPRISVKAGESMALTGPNTFRKHYLCDWLLGFVSATGSHVNMTITGRTLTDASDRTQVAAVLGRSPLLYGETIQEALLYRTYHVRKKVLYDLIERFYGPSLRARTNPASPLFDRNDKPVPTQILTAREHIEIAQINLLLQKTPLVVLDLSSELMNEALAQGFRPARELFESGKTVLVIVPPSKDLAWAEHILDHQFTQSLSLT